MTTSNRTTIVLDAELRKALRDCKDPVQLADEWVYFEIDRAGYVVRIVEIGLP